jgi:hypothetical protein
MLGSPRGGKGQSDPVRLTDRLRGDAREAFATLSPPKGLVTIVGGDHIIPYVADSTRPETTPNQAASLAFFDHYLKRLPDAPSRLRAVDDLPNADIELALN